MNILKKIFGLGSNKPTQEAKGEDGLKEEKPRQTQITPPIRGTNYSTELLNTKQIDRHSIYSDNSNCLMALVAYGGMNEAKTIYQVCVDFLSTNPALYNKIKIIELSYVNSDAVVCICGVWDEKKGLALPWDKLPAGVDIWLDVIGRNFYRGKFISGACQPKMACSDNDFGKKENREISALSSRSELEDAKVFCERGGNLVQQKKYQEATKELNIALSINPSYALAYYHRGTAYQGIGNHNKAIEDFTKAISLKSNDPDYYINRAISKHNLTLKEEEAFDKVKLYHEALEDLNIAIGFGQGDKGAVAVQVSALIKKKLDEEGNRRNSIQSPTQVTQTRIDSTKKREQVSQNVVTPISSDIKKATPYVVDDFIKSFLDIPYLSDQSVAIKKLGEPEYTFCTQEYLIGKVTQFGYKIGDDRCIRLHHYNDSKNVYYIGVSTPINENASGKYEQNISELKKFLQSRSITDSKIAFLGQGMSAIVKSLTKYSIDRYMNTDKSQEIIYVKLPGGTISFYFSKSENWTCTSISIDWSEERNK